MLELNIMLPQEMIVDSSLLDVSTVIGQGLCEKMTQAMYEKFGLLLSFILTSPGEFGVVYRGTLRTGSVSQLVAVKSLKGNNVTLT